MDATLRTFAQNLLTGQGVDDDEALERVIDSELNRRDTKNSDMRQECIASISRRLAKAKKNGAPESVIKAYNAELRRITRQSKSRR